jgi:hypothetical protein
MGRTRSRSPRGGLAWFLVAAFTASLALTGPTTSVAGAQSASFLPAILSVVRIGNDGTFDRVVFEFVGDTVPTATLDGPKTNTGTVPSDPSNQPVTIAGASVVTVHMNPAIATYAASNPPQVYTGPTTFSPTATANVVQVTETGDFESVLSWSIGLKAGTAVTVHVLTNPTRVVVDVPHVAATPAQPVPQTPVLTG